MKVNELIEGIQKGTYAGVRFSKPTVKMLKNLIEKYNIPNPIPSNKLHTTLLYSRKYLPKYTPKGKIDPPMLGKFTGFDIWESDKDNTRCLVMEYSCPNLKSRHKELMKEHDATYDFPVYKPHVTLSYDIGDANPDLPVTVDDLEIVNEYGEDLNLDWAEENTEDKNK